MTISKEVSTETLKDFIIGQGYGVAPSAVVSICEELLAVREAQPVAWTDREELAFVNDMACMWTKGMGINEVPLYTAPPAAAAAVLNGVSILTAGIDTCNDRFEIEIVDWDVDSAVKPNSKVIPDGYKLVPIEAQHAPVVPDFGALAKLLVENLVDCGAADDDVIAQYKEFAHKACRAAMLPSAPKAD